MKQSLNLLLVIILMVIFSLSGCKNPKSNQSAPQPTPSPKANTSKVIDGFSSPESIIIDPKTKRIFVSNMGVKLEPMNKNNDGYISEISTDGKIIAKKVFPKTGYLNAPKGMAIIDNTLFVTDVDRVVGFNIETREQTFVIDFSKEKAKFLNDLAVFEHQTLLVSATDIGKIYIISIKDKKYSHLIDVPGANGLFYDKPNQKVFVASFSGEKPNSKGVLGVISFQNNGIKYKKLTEPIGFLDGIAVLTGSRVLFSDWGASFKNGIIHIYNLRTKQLSTIKLSQKVMGPADFLYDHTNKVIWLPKMMEGKILIEKIE